MQDLMDKLLKNKWLIFVLLWDDFKDSLYDQTSLNLVKTIKKVWQFKDSYILDDYILIDQKKIKELLEIVNRFEKTEWENQEN